MHASSPSFFVILFFLPNSPDECILLDCGEGTLSQLYALHGIEKTHNLLRGLRLILITHMHADHHGVSGYLIGFETRLFYALMRRYCRIFLSKNMAVKMRLVGTSISSVVGFVFGWLEWDLP